MIFDYIETLTSTPKRLTIEAWNQLTESDHVKTVCAQVAAGHKELKKNLPAIMWQATYNGKPRKNENAESSGLYMLDIDHIDDPRGTYEKMLTQFNYDLSPLGIMVVHITPSGKGLRLVAMMLAEQGFKTIAEYQKWLAEKLGLSEYDACTKDLARMSFAVPAANVLYFNASIFDLEPSARVSNVQPSLFESEAVELPKQSISEKLQTTYNGHPLSEIWSKLVDLVLHKPIEEGDRNSSIYRVSLLFRYICDNSPRVIVSNIPDYGLPRSEFFKTVQNACNYELTAKGMNAMQRYLKEMYETSESPNDPAPQSIITPPVLNFDLPPVFQQFVNTCPDDFKVPMIMGILPVLGTVATGVRSVYLDGVTHSPSFFSVLEAPQASGKGFLRNMVLTLTERIRFDDMQERAKEAAYKEELRRSKNKAKQPEDPRAAVRLVPASISIAQLLKRLDYADGKHLFTFCEEIDTLTKSNKSGAWSQKSDIYRNAFDNAEYGQDYISDNTYSAIVKVFYNLLVLGTPKAVRRFFSDPEDGLCSRICFITLPDQFGAKMPHFSMLTNKQSATVAKIVERLMKDTNIYKLDYLGGEVEKWLEEKRRLSLETQNNTINIFMRRCAVIGFRAALLAHAVYGKPQQKHKEQIIKFFRFVADYSLYELFRRFDGKVDDDEQTSNYASVNFYSQLAERFTLNELAALLKSAGMKTPAKAVAYRLRKAGLIKSIQRGEFQKI